MPVVYERCRDGDTVEVSLPGSAFIWAVRLLDCWCPGTDTEIGRNARFFAELTMEEAEEPLLWMPLPTGRNLLQCLSFDRIIGVLFLGDDLTLNNLMIERGYASSKKSGRLGE